MGITNFDTVQANAFLGANVVTQGKQFYVKPVSGSDSNSGRSPARAVKTLSKALSLATEDQNDVIWFMGEGVSIAECTHYVTTAGAAALDWNKDCVHLFGINSQTQVAQRSRVEFESTFVTATNLFTLSANGCIIKDMHFFAGVADTNPTGCMLVTGERNHLINCHIAGIGHANNDIAGAYSVKLTGSENVFTKCAIGLDTIARGTQANSGLLMDTASTRNMFNDCLFIAWVEHATNHVHVRLADATSVDRWLWFKNCTFMYMSTNYGVGATGVFKLTNAITKGYIVVQNCMAFSDKPSVTVKWDVDDRDKIVVVGPILPAADSCNVGKWV